MQVMKTMLQETQNQSCLWIKEKAQLSMQQQQLKFLEEQSKQKMALMREQQQLQANTQAMLKKSNGDKLKWIEEEKKKREQKALALQKSQFIFSKQEVDPRQKQVKQASRNARGHQNT